MVSHVTTETQTLTGQRQRPYTSGSMGSENAYYSLNPTGSRPTPRSEYSIIAAEERPPESMKIFELPELIIPGVTRSDNMVRINGGTFAMGSPSNEPNRRNDEGPQHQVTVGSFYMGRYEVTLKEYREVMGTEKFYYLEKDNFPVVVSWYESIEYCNKRSQMEGLTPAYTINGINVIWNRNANGYRLPTEAEWEYACRAGTTTTYNIGANINDVVGQKPANAWGLFDMHGSEWEWCWDWYGDYSGAAQTDPVGAVSGTRRVIRSGHSLYGDLFLRSAMRHSEVPSSGRTIYSIPNMSGETGIGFRIVCN
jgi:formylglycine-generating enzyme required for sulfatase activity